MDALAPCPSCSRHIRVDEPRCPFCQTVTSGLQPMGFDPSLAPVRVRAAVLALGASMALGACVNPMANVYGGPPIPPPAHDAQTQAPPLPSPQPVYDAPPPAPLDASAMVPPTPPPPVQEPAPEPAPTRRPRPPRRVRDPGAPVPLYGVPPGPDREGP